MNCAKVDGLIPGVVDKPESSLRRGQYCSQTRDNLPLHGSTPDCHCGPFERRRLEEPVERQYAARPGTDGSQDTADQPHSPKQLTVSKMYSAMMNVEIKLFQGIVGSSKRSSTCYSRASVTINNGQGTARSAAPVRRRGLRPMSADARTISPCSQVREKIKVRGVHPRILHLN